jgi:hypothetical protein
MSWQLTHNHRSWTDAEQPTAQKTVRSEQHSKFYIMFHTFSVYRTPYFRTSLTDCQQMQIFLYKRKNRDRHIWPDTQVYKALHLHHQTKVNHYSSGKKYFILTFVQISTNISKWKIISSITNICRKLVRVYKTIKNWYHYQWHIKERSANSAEEWLHYFSQHLFKWMP